MINKLKDFPINWKPLVYHKSPPVISTILDILALFKESKNIYLKEKFDIVHCRSYISALVGVKLKKQFNIKFIFDMRGFWADERVDGGLWSLSNPVYRMVYRYFKKKEQIFLTSADAIISLTHAGKKEMAGWDNATRFINKVTVIPCMSDFSLFDLTDARKKAQSKSRLGIRNNQFVLSYVGSIGTWYLLNDMISFFSVLKRDMPDAVFLFLTPGKGGNILTVAKQHGLKEDDFVIRYVPRESLTSVAQAADFTIFFIKPAYSKIASSPTKMGEALAMGIPILCNAGVGDVEKIINDTDGGICLDRLDSQSFSAAVDRMKDWDYSTRESSRKKARAFLDLDVGVQAYRQIYDGLLASAT